MGSLAPGDGNRDGQIPKTSSPRRVDSLTLEEQNSPSLFNQIEIRSPVPKTPILRHTVLPKRIQNRLSGSDLSEGVFKIRRIPRKHRSTVIKNGRPSRVPQQLIQPKMPLLTALHGSLKDGNYQTSAAMKEQKDEDIYSLAEFRGMRNSIGDDLSTHARLVTKDYPLCYDCGDTGYQLCKMCKGRGFTYQCPDCLRDTSKKEKGNRLYCIPCKDDEDALFDCAWCQVSGWVYRRPPCPNLECRNQIQLLKGSRRVHLVHIAEMRLALHEAREEQDSIYNTPPQDGSNIAGKKDILPAYNRMVQASVIGRTRGTLIIAPRGTVEGTPLREVSGSWDRTQRLAEVRSAEQSSSQISQEWSQCFIRR